MSDVISNDFTVLLRQVKALSVQQTIRLLGLVTMELTIVGRETYDPHSMGIQDPVKLRALNECQHFLLGVLRCFLFDEEVDIESFAQSLLSLSTDQHIGDGLQAAFRRGARQMQPFQPMQ